MKILAFDPGETTGWALVSLTLAEPIRDRVVVPITGTLELWRGVYDLIDKHAPDFIVVEIFRLFPHRLRAQIGSTFPTVKVIGVIEYIADGFGISVVLQEPSDRLQVKGWWSTNYLPKSMRITSHERSALQHALLFLRRQGCL